MVVIALDVGDRRIGVAASDPTGFLASSVGVIKRDGTKERDEFARKEILALVKDRAAGHLLIGLPKNMDGTEGFQADKVRSFMAPILEAFPNHSFWDERLSSVSANRLMAQTKTKVKKRKQEVDQIAACYILQSYLDSREFKERMIQRNEE